MTLAGVCLAEVRATRGKNVIGLMKKTEIVFFDAGGAHRSMASGLKSAIEQGDSTLQPVLVNLQEVLDSIDVFRKITGLRLEDVYNLILSRRWTLGLDKFIPPMQWLIRVWQSRAVALIRRHWESSSPDLVVSVVPHFNRALWLSLQGLGRKVPFVTIPVDFADYPPHFWVEPNQQQYFIWGTDRGIADTERFGYDSRSIFRVSGVILDPKFYATAPVDRNRERVRLGLDPDKPVGLVLFGGAGSFEMFDIARRLSAKHQLILLCGRSDALAARMRTLRPAAPMVIEGFTPDVPRYMQLADYFIGKPGPGSVSEAVAMRLPVIVEANAWTLPQERYNAQWVREMGVGTVLPNFRGIARAVEELLEPGAYQRFRDATGHLENRAVFEIPGILERIAKANR